MQTFKVEGKFPSLNQYTNQNRRNRYAGAKMKKEFTELVAWNCQKINKIKNKATFKFIWHEKNRRRDKDNVAFNKKFVLDGLIEGGKLENDGWGEIEGFADEFILDKKWQGVVVEIEEVKGES